MNRVFDSIEDRLSFIEFRQYLLFVNDDVSRLLFECEITQEEYGKINDLFDSLRKKMEEGEEINSAAYEEEIYKIVPSLYGNYHFCESIAELFYKDGRWEEVFKALYGDSIKFSYLFK